MSNRNRAVSQALNFHDPIAQSVHLPDVEIRHTDSGGNEAHHFRDM